MTETKTPHHLTKYPFSMRVLHWLRAFLIIGLIGSGWYMSGIWESDAGMAEFLYPNHKQFGVLVWLLAVVHLTLRWKYHNQLPASPALLTTWEKNLSHIIHRTIMVLTFLIPLLGYSMSSSFTQSDGVPFFFISHIPEILPKNDQAFELFQTLHKYGAYALLVCVLLHILGAFKHRLIDKDGETDVLPRML